MYFKSHQEDASMEKASGIVQGKWRRNTDITLNNKGEWCFLFIIEEWHLMMMKKNIYALDISNIDLHIQIYIRQFSQYTNIYM